MDFRKLNTDPAPLYINSKCGENPHLQVSWGPHLCRLLQTSQQLSRRLRSGDTLSESQEAQAKLQAAVDLLLSLLTNSIWNSSCTVTNRVRL